jgi:HD superfamily phosphohydrolase YqeK
MSLAEKILFFADYIEETRSQEPCRIMREHFYRQMPQDPEERHRWLDRCIRKAMDDTLLYLKENNQTFHPLTLRARESLFRKENQ